MTLQINIVAGGGHTSAGGIFELTETVELNVAGERRWSYGTPLAKPIWGARGVTILSNISKLSEFYITGGKCEASKIAKKHEICFQGTQSTGEQFDNAEDNVLLYAEDEWVVVGQMMVSREFHAVSIVNFDDYCKEY